MYLIRVPTVGTGVGNALTAEAAKIETALKQGGLPAFTRQQGTIVSPAVGQELRSKALLATVFSLAGLLAYIAFRFQFSFAVGAVVATIHDLLVTLAFLAIFQYDMSLNVIAAILTITGFSTNDTIVIFDRIRENLRVDAARLAGPRHQRVDQPDPRPDDHHLGHRAFSPRSRCSCSAAKCCTAFAFTMIVGIVTGTYSSVFIAAAIISFWRGAARRGPQRTHT